MISRVAHMPCRQRDLIALQRQLIGVEDAGHAAFPTTVRGIRLERTCRRRISRIGSDIACWQIIFLHEDSQLAFHLRLIIVPANDASSACAIVQTGHRQRR